MYSSIPAIQVSGSGSDAESNAFSPSAGSANTSVPQIVLTASYASFAESALSASYAPGSPSLSSSYALLATSASNVIGGGVVGTPSVPVTTLYADNVSVGTFLEVDYIASYNLADTTNVWTDLVMDGGNPSPTKHKLRGTASYADNALTASYALSGVGGGGGTTLTTGSTYPVTASWSVSASYAPFVQAYQTNTISSSYASRSLSASLAIVAESSDFALTAGSATTSTSSSYAFASTELVTGLSGSIRESTNLRINYTNGGFLAFQNNAAELNLSTNTPNANLAIIHNGTNAGTLSITSGNDTVPIAVQSYGQSSPISLTTTAASSQITISTGDATSDIELASAGDIRLFGSKVQVSSGLEATGSLSGTSSYANRALTASYALSGVGGGTTLTTGSLYYITSSWAKSSSYYPPQTYQTSTVSASYASRSLSASYAPFTQTYQTSTVSASYASRSLSASYAPFTQTYQTSTVSSSWSSSSLSSSYANRSAWSDNTSTAVYAFSSTSASYSDATLTSSYVRMLSGSGAWKQYIDFSTGNLVFTYS